MLENPDGIYAIRCLSYVDGYFNSPVYVGFVWTANWKTAQCYMGDEVPCDQHGEAGGCGFHGVYEYNSAINFARSIGIRSLVMVLAEYAGNIVSHERGLRAQHCRVRAVLDWDARKEINHDANFWAMIMPEAPPNLIEMALKHFLVPLLDPNIASNLIRSSNQKIVIGKSGFQTFTP